MSSTTQLTSEFDPQLEQTTLPPSTTQLTSEFDPQLEQTASSQNETTIGSPLPIQNNEGFDYRFQSTDLKQGRTWQSVSVYRFQTSKTTASFNPSLSD